MGKVIVVKLDDETDLWLRRYARTMGIGVCGLLKRWVREDVALVAEQGRREREAKADSTTTP